MNRLKVFVYVALVTAAGAWSVHVLSRWLTERSLRQMDRDLLGAAASIQARPPAPGPEGLFAADALRGLRQELGIDVTLLSDGRVLQSTLGPREAALVASAGRGAEGRPASVGTLAPQRPGLELPFPAPALPLVLVSAPAHRVVTVPSPAGAGVLAVSQPAAAVLAPVVTAQWLGLTAVVALFLLGLIFVLLVGEEQRAVLPRDLLVAADRVARGDFTARAPVMAGRVGTLATALNRAAEAAAAAVAPRPQDPTGAAPLSGTGLSDLGAALESEPAFVAPLAQPAPHAPEPLAPADDPASEPPWSALASATGPASAMPPEPAPAEDEPAPANVAERVPSAPSAQPEESTARDFFAPPAGTTSYAPLPPEPPPAPSPAPSAAPAAQPAPAAWAAGDEDEEHWRAVYQDFQRVRAECGESRNGVSYERLREKLQKNRDQLVERYGCRTVRFQVYAKDGKAALKASPVR